MSDERIVTDEWLTKNQLAKKLGKSLAAVTRLTKMGRVTPIQTEHGNRYDPAEVAELLSDPSVYSKPSDERRDEFAEIQLGVVKEMLGLVGEPRKEIDKIQFEMIRELREENKALREKIAAMWMDVEAARDGKAERDAALVMVKQDSDIKKIAAARMFDTLGKLIAGKNVHGVQLTPDQLAELVTASEDGGEPFLTPDQVKEAKQVIIQHKAKTNGKETVGAVVKNITDTVGATK